MLVRLRCPFPAHIPVVAQFPAGSILVPGYRTQVSFAIHEMLLTVYTVFKDQP